MNCNIKHNNNCDTNCDTNRNKNSDTNCDLKKLLERAVDYIEDNLCGELNVKDVAAQAYSSEYHFQRTFSFITGETIGEYIRKRRIYFAATEMKKGASVTDTAIKYGYDPGGFSKAFKAEYGASPSEFIRKNMRVYEYPKMTVPDFSKTDGGVIFKIKAQKAFKLVGYKARFYGAPCGKNRATQEEKFFRSTRAKQWLLRGASASDFVFCILSNFTPDGYDYYVAYPLDDCDIADLFNPNTSGISIEQFGYEVIEIPERLYAVFSTDRQQKPIAAYAALRNSIGAGSLNGYRLANGAEIVKIHWLMKKERANRFVEIMLPVEKI